MANCITKHFTEVPCGHFTKDFGSNLEGETLVNLFIRKFGSNFIYEVAGVDGSQIRVSGDLSNFLATGGQYEAVIKKQSTNEPLTFVDSKGNEAQAVQFEITPGHGSGVFLFSYA